MQRLPPPAGTSSPTYSPPPTCCPRTCWRKCSLTRAPSSSQSLARVFRNLTACRLRCLTLPVPPTSHPYPPTEVLNTPVPDSARKIVRRKHQHLQRPLRQQYARHHPPPRSTPTVATGLPGPNHCKTSPAWTPTSMESADNEALRCVQALAPRTPLLMRLCYPLRPSLPLTHRPYRRCPTPFGPPALTGSTPPLLECRAARLLAPTWFWHHSVAGAAAIGLPLAQHFILAPAAAYTSTQTDPMLVPTVEYVRVLESRQTYLQCQFRDFEVQTKSVIVCTDKVCL